MIDDLIDIQRSYNPTFPIFSKTHKSHKAFLIKYYVHERIISRFFNETKNLRKKKEKNREVQQSIRSKYSPLLSTILSYLSSKRWIFVFRQDPVIETFLCFIRQLEVESDKARCIDRNRFGVIRSSNVQWISWLLEGVANKSHCGCLLS